MMKSRSNGSRTAIVFDSAKSQRKKREAQWDIAGPYGSIFGIVS